MYGLKTLRQQGDSLAELQRREAAMKTAQGECARRRTVWSCWVSHRRKSTDWIGSMTIKADVALARAVRRASYHAQYHAG